MCVHHSKRWALIQRGIDSNDRLYLDTLINKFSGGPVGVDTLAASMSEESETLEDVIEPYLLQKGYLDRTAKGRMATDFMSIWGCRGLKNNPLISNHYFRRKP